MVSKNTNALKTHAPGRSGMILPGVRTAGLMGGGGIQHDEQLLGVRAGHGIGDAGRSTLSC